MNDSNFLIVPMMVEALVVNDPVRLGGNTFIRTPMTYNALQFGLNGQPGWSDNDVHFTSPDVVPPNNTPSDQYYNGIYLKWRLPLCFTKGQRPDQDLTQAIKYPPVPNRWMVIRYDGENLASRNATAWIIESDYQWPAEHPAPNTASELGSIYVNPNPTRANIPEGIRIGRNIDLSTGQWSEPNTTLKLNVMGPGNPAFAFYQPHCNNVFSFIDPLGNQPNAPQGTPWLYSYMVIGWFAQPTDDPLQSSTPNNFAEILQSLQWGIQGTAPAQPPTATLLYGSILSVPWQNSLPPPTSDRSANNQISVTVGNTSVEALTALITARADDAQMSIDAQLLEAFQLDALDVLDEPDGAAVLAEKLHTTFFQKYAGGYLWKIVNIPNDTTLLSEQELATEAAWLAILNQNQNTLDTAIRQLTALQTQLYIFWWKYIRWAFAYEVATSIPGLNTANDLIAQLDPTVQNSAAQKVWNQLQVIQQLSDPTIVPNGATPALLETAIQAYCEARKLPSTRILKRVDYSPYYLANNPVVLLSGKAISSSPIDTPSVLLCRLNSQLITGFEYNNQTISASTPKLVIPQPNLIGVTGVPWSATLINTLVQEFFFLDASNATMIAQAISDPNVTAIHDAMAQKNNDIGLYPAGAYQLWTENPWRPLLLQWQAYYYPIDYDVPASTGGTLTPSWTFEEGHYEWNGNSASIGQAKALQGVIQLSPTAVFNMGARIASFLQNNPHLDVQEENALKNLYSLVKEDDNWDLLSQALDGFNEQIQLGQSGVFMKPPGFAPVTNPPIETLLQGSSIYPPGLSVIPETAPDTSDFQSLRSGQFVFLNLAIVDEWGQAVWPINTHNYQTTNVIVPPDMMPVIATEPVAFAITSASQVTDKNLSNATIPVINLLQPNLIQAGSAIANNTELSILGNNFTADCTVLWTRNDNTLPATSLTTSFLSASNLVAQIPANLLWNPGAITVSVTNSSGSSQALFTISVGAAIGSLSPAAVISGSAAFTLSITGVGFNHASQIQWNQNGVLHKPTTTFVSATELNAQIPADWITTAGTVAISEFKGTNALHETSDSLIQLSPRLLQPAKLNFDLLSAENDSIVLDPLYSEENPICGWIVPNHLNSSLNAYDTTGHALGEMRLRIDATTGNTVIKWLAAPSIPPSLEQLYLQIPSHFTKFLYNLYLQTPATFSVFLKSVDETLWSTAPIGAAFDQSLAVLMGRPLALVRSQLQFELAYDAYPDPSWQFTFAQNPSPGLSSYAFAVELGNNARIEDGLIGYFLEDQYDIFNIVQQATDSTANSYLKPIGVDNNYIYMPFDGKTATHLSMLIDPRANVHATTDILPTIAVNLPEQFTTDALESIQIMFDVSGILTDQKTITSNSNPQSNDTTVLMPIPQTKTGDWAWLENDAGTWTPYAVGINDTAARLTDESPVLRRGVLQLSSALTETSNKES